MTITDDDCPLKPATPGQAYNTVLGQGATNYPNVPGASSSGSLRHRTNPGQDAPATLYPSSAVCSPFSTFDFL